MNAYDQKDFSANPDKYKLFSTATVAVNDDICRLTKGEIVGIRYAFTTRNVGRSGLDEPVYWVSKLETHLFGSALADFIL